MSDRDRERPNQCSLGLLLNTAGWGQFYDLRVVSADPPGPAAPGQRLIGVPGRGVLPLRTTFDFTEVDSISHRLGFDRRIPFGTMVREDIKLAEVDEAHCWVNYNCDSNFRPAYAAINRRSKPLGVKIQEGGFSTPQAAKQAGEAALRELLRELTREE